MSKNIAIITAAGNGRRMKSKHKKQYMLLSEKPILSYTISVFQNCQDINEIIIVAPKADLEYVQQEIIIPYKFDKVTQVISGGKERQDSVFNALELDCFSKDDVVLIHDGVRPFISEDIILKGLELKKKCHAVVTGVPMKDTVQIWKDNIPSKILERNSLISIQTPQIFSYTKIKEIYIKALLDKFYGTDDSSLWIKYSQDEIKLNLGSYKNIKITTPEDVMFGEFILSQLNNENIRI